MKKKYLLFDLDGTLTDSKEGIMNGVTYMLNYFGIQVEDRQSLFSWIGPPLKWSLKEYYGFDDEKIAKAIEQYREYYVETGMFENEVYPGIESLLKELYAMGYELYTATSKPAPAAVAILEHFGIAQYFNYIGGATLDESRSEKEEVIAHVLEVNHITDKSQVLMIGDRKFDVEGAKIHRLECLGVLYGYGNREEFQIAGADYIAETVEDIKNFI